jgi:hypothetical protein
LQKRVIQFPRTLDMQDYDPLSAPFELPTQQLTVRCLAERPLYLQPRAGATAGTTLWGAFGEALLKHACIRHVRGWGACIESNVPCLASCDCPVPWLYKPYSQVHRRNLARPVLLYARALESQLPVDAFDLEVTLWGRRAVATWETIERALRAMGATGLQAGEEPVRFEIGEIWARPVKRLAERTAVLQINDWHQALLVFETPFLHREQVEIEPGVRQKLFMAGGVLPLAEILGNVAYELTAWDIEDRELSDYLDRETRHNLCRQARETARQAIKTSQIIRCELNPVPVGLRASRETGHVFPLAGFTGQVELSGSLHHALPWLITLALGGGGQKRSMGFGRVCLWLGPFISASATDK